MKQQDKIQATAVYSMPNNTSFYEVTGPLSQITPEEIFEDPGFVFAPYHSKNFPVYRISGHPGVIDPSDIDLPVRISCPYDIQNVSREDYQELFDSCMATIRAGTLRKIVLSIRQIEDRPFNSIPDFLKRLRNAYPAAFIYLFYIQDQECWIGASPELLLDTQYPFQRTVALAGTMKDAPNLKDWKEKEREEQHLVEVFLDKVFEGRPFRKEGPQPVKAGPVYHLVTKYFIQIESQPVNPAEIHPSPALSGFPKEESMEFLSKTERHDRRYYTGFLGPVWSHGHSKFFINLRCLEVFSEKIALYAGGGLTVNSDSDREWMEIQHKLSTLRSKFHQD